MKDLLAALALGATLAVPAAAQDAARDADAGERPAIVQDYQPDPAIWLLQDEDTKIYLFGTIHVLPEGFRWRSPGFDAIVAEADELILETSDDDAASDEDFAGLLHAIRKHQPVSPRLSPGNAEKWLALAASAGLPPEAFDRLPPVLAMFAIGGASNREQTGAEGEFGVETVLEDEFHDAGKPIGSIESPTEVMASLLTINEAAFIKSLDRELSRWSDKAFRAATQAAAGKPLPPAKAELALRTEHAWAQGYEVDARSQLHGYEDVGLALDKVLLDNRNRAWAGWLERRLAEPGTVLVAVGAAHLAGENSVRVMLAKRGLASERVN